MTKMNGFNMHKYLLAVFVLSFAPLTHAETCLSQEDIDQAIEQTNADYKITIVKQRIDDETGIVHVSYELDQDGEKTYFDRSYIQTACMDAAQNLVQELPSIAQPALSTCERLEKHRILNQVVGILTPYIGLIGGALIGRQLAGDYATNDEQDNAIFIGAIAGGLLAPLVPAATIANKYEKGGLKYYGITAGTIATFGALGYALKDNGWAPNLSLFTPGVAGYYGMQLAQSGRCVANQE